MSEEEIQQLVEQAGIPSVFVREHDVILMAVPFSAIARPASFTHAHGDRLRHALERHFIRSIRMVERSGLRVALEKSNTPLLTYRLTTNEDFSGVEDSLLLACTPRAHLALTIILERDALFDVELIGRVSRYSSPTRPFTVRKAKPSAVLCRPM